MSPAKKTTAPDYQVSYFYYRSELTIDPPLPDAVVKSFTNPFLSLKQKKDEDVAFVDGAITVVSTNITSVLSNHKSTDNVSGYDNLKKGVGNLFALVAKAGSTVNGYILVRRAEEDYEQGSPEFFRLVPFGSNGVVVVQAAQLAWPDGTAMPVPEGEGL